MDENYFNRFKMGGSVQAYGSAYQDLVSLLYMFNHINSNSFKEITFETDDDFTMIMDTHEIYVQVKNTQLTTAQVREILKLKNVNTKNQYVKHIVVASRYDQKFNSLLKKRTNLDNVNKTFRREQEKNVIAEQFDHLLQKNGIDPATFHGCVFKEIPDAQIEETIKFHMYRWSEAQNWEIEIEDVFNKLITNISLHLRPDRGSLNRKEIEELVVSCSRREIVKQDIQQNIIHFNDSKESILLALSKDIAEKKIFSDKLILIKLYIETEKLDDALKLACEIYEYEETFMYYYLWLLYKLGKINKLNKYCNEMIKKNACLYYSHYFKALGLLEKKDYFRAINSLKDALSNDSTFEVNFILAKVYNLVGKYDASLEHYLFCKLKQPLNEEVLVGISSLVPKHEAIVYLDQVIEINPKFYRAYLEKGKILRYYGMNNDAYDYFQQYLDYHYPYEKGSNEVLREISLCLLSMNDERAFKYLNSWLSDLLFNEYNDKIIEGEEIVICDSSWKNNQLILCTKSGEDYIIRTSIREYLLIKGEDSRIAIGCTVDSFLEMTKDIFEEHTIIENGYQYIPSIIKVYRYKKEFDKVINLMSLQDNAGLNKDYYFTMGKDRWRFKEYISKNKATSILVEELKNAIHVRIQVGIAVITGWFNKGGENYFKFCSKVENPTAFEEAVLILECGQAKQKVHIKFKVQTIEIVKSAYYPRVEYVRDVKLPI